MKYKYLILIILSLLVLSGLYLYFIQNKSVQKIQVKELLLGADSGALSPGTVVSDATVGISVWGNPNNAKVSDGVYTTATVGLPPCFLAGTKITTKNGLKNIESIIVGDYVLSYNPKTKEQKIVKVLQVFRHKATEYVVLKTANRVVETTQNHPFLTTNGWKEVHELLIGDELITDNGIETLTTKKVVEQNVGVFNLEVEEPHTYFANGFVVHNKPGANFTTVKLVNSSGTIVGTNNASGALDTASSSSYKSFGGSSDLWGSSWGVTDINNSNFGVVFNFTGTGYSSNKVTHYLKATNFGFSIPTGATINGVLTEIQGYEQVGSGGTADIDHIRITVFFTESATNSCSYSGVGNWDVLGSDACYITSNVYVNGEFNLIGGSFGCADGVRISATKFNFGAPTEMESGCMAWHQ